VSFAQVPDSMDHEPGRLALENARLARELEGRKVDLEFNRRELAAFEACAARLRDQIARTRRL